MPGTRTEKNDATKASIQLRRLATRLGQQGSPIVEEETVYMLGCQYISNNCSLTRFFRFFHNYIFIYQNSYI